MNKSIKLRNLVCANYLFFIACLFYIGISPVIAEDNKDLASLAQQVMDAKSNDQAYLALESLADSYFDSGKFSDFIAFLGSLSKQKKDLEPATNYYTALSRYYQLKYLEDKQDWDEYFSKGNDYREQIRSSLDKAISSLDKKDPLSIYARILLWKFHKDQEDVFSAQASKDLSDAIAEYLKDAQNLAPVKAAADEFFDYGEKANARQLYKMYTDKIISSELKDDDLKKIAASAYAEGNLYLSESLYDAYLERWKNYKKEEKGSPAELAEIAKSFVYPGLSPKANALNDPSYAEKIFKIIEDWAGKDAFNEELMYLRALNLEKSGELKDALRVYGEFIGLFPSSKHYREASFKAGIISAYVLADVKSAKNYLEQIALNKDITDAYTVSSLYQLGILSQWEGDLEKAKSFYARLLEVAADAFKETASLARERLKEIEESKPIEYNTKIFLDSTLKGEFPPQADLKALPSTAKKDTDVNISSSVFIGETGCMSVELEYLWTGDKGKTQPTKQQSSFSTQYSEPGTKVIGVTVTTPAGIAETDIVMLDVG